MEICNSLDLKLHVLVRNKIFFSLKLADSEEAVPYTEIKNDETYYIKKITRKNG